MKFQRFAFVSLVCLLSVPWLTPCVGVLGGAVIHGVHKAVQGRDDVLDRLPNDRLRQWAAKPARSLVVVEKVPVPARDLVSEEDVSSARGGRSVASPGNLLGKGLSAVANGLATTLVAADPLVLGHADDGVVIDQVRKRPSIVLCEQPFVFLDAEKIRVTREEKNGLLEMVRATGGIVRVITADGTITAHAGEVHFRSGTDYVVLEHPRGVRTAGGYVRPAASGAMMRLHFSARRLECDGPVRFDGASMVRFVP